MSEPLLKKVSDIKIIDKLYPRTAKDTKTIQSYAENIEVLPPIEINQNNILIDGAHRLSAYKQCKKEEIPCIVTQTDTEEDLYLLALQRNAIHGLQLSMDDKQKVAIRLCGSIDDAVIIKSLSISDRTYRGWTKNKRKQLEKDRDSKVIDLWLQCYNNSEIEKLTEVSDDTVKRIIEKLKDSQNGKDAEMRNFTPQLYNIWNFSRNSQRPRTSLRLKCEAWSNIYRGCMKILIACEFSGIVREAFRLRNHDAWSCDLLPSEIPGRHHIGDVVDILDLGWDMMIAHPPCTYLTNAGVRHLYDHVVSRTGKHAAVYGAARWEAMRKAAIFFRRLLNVDIPKVVIENPIPHKYAVVEIGRKYDQLIQPWQFGHGETKATCLWLRGLPKLQPTNIVSGREARIHKMPPSEHRAKDRSRTYQGIANAMSEQWG